MVPAMKINDMAKMAYDNSRAHGFWDGVEPYDVRVIPLKLVLIHSEVSEALEVYREEPDEESVRAPRYSHAGKPIGLDSELADIIIRVGDLAAHLGIDLERAITEKHLYNVSRPRMHGKRA
jgi:NTP pyrophosphatase (non-canonical NTP hydrolase)